MHDRYWRRDHLVGRRPVPSLVEAIGYVGPAADLAAARLSGSGEVSPETLCLQHQQVAQGDARGTELQGQFPSAYRLKPTGGVHAVSDRSPIPALSVPHDLCPCHVRLLTAPSAFRAESYLRGSVCSISPPFVFLSTRLWGPQELPVIRQLKGYCLFQQEAPRDPVPALWLYPFAFSSFYEGKDTVFPNGESPASSTEWKMKVIISPRENTNISRETPIILMFTECHRLLCP
ncbi:uncharacterized protein [Equus asinus]|uniref:uncharacterized protein n=1 Tax=Equus asinus TaxID=9793 RepID=UPI0038F74C77